MVVGVAIAATASAYAAPATSSRAGATSHYVTGTYACLVRPQRYIDTATSVTLPSVNGLARPAEVWLDTAGRFEKSDKSKALPQVEFEAVKNSLRIDNVGCVRSSRRVPLKPGLPLYETVTTSFYGHIDARCKAAKRVLVRVRIKMNGGTPTQALIAIRTDDAKHRPVEFFNWTPRKIKGYIGSSCTDTG